MKYTKLFEEWLITEGVNDSVRPMIEKLKKEAELNHSKLKAIILNAKKRIQTTSDGEEIVFSPDEMLKIKGLIQSSLSKIKNYNVSEEHFEIDGKYPTSWIIQKAKLAEYLRNPSKYITKFGEMKGKEFEDWNEFMEESVNSYASDSPFNGAGSHSVEHRAGMAAGLSSRTHSFQKQNHQPALYITTPFIPGNKYTMTELETGFSRDISYFSVIGYADGGNDQFFKIDVDSFYQAQEAIKLTIGNSNFINLVNSILENTWDMWVLQSFQSWKDKAPYRAEKEAELIRREEQAEYVEKFIKPVIKTKNFYKDGTTVTDPNAYSVKDFEKIAIMFNDNGTTKDDTFAVIKKGPALVSKEGRFSNIAPIYFEYSSGRWTGGFDTKRSTQEVDMSLEEFVYAILHNGFIM